MSEKDVFGFEIDFLPVQKMGKSGDAICMRWGYNLLDANLRRQVVMLVDAGYDETGSSVVEHVREYYKTNFVQCLVNTHPHDDHIGGIPKVVTELNVGYFAIHQPWAHIGWKGVSKNRGLEDLRRFVTTTAVDSYEWFSDNGYAFELMGVRVDVLGPTRKYYDSIWSDLELGTEDSLSSDEDTVRTVNNSGVILAFTLKECGGKTIILTGDAGAPALTAAFSEARRRNPALLQNVAIFQLPHHGSDQNFETSVLDFMDLSSAMVCVSAADQDRLHPGTEAVNACISRGASVFATRGKIMRQAFGDCPLRDGWVTAKPLSRFRHTPESGVSGQEVGG